MGWEAAVLAALGIQTQAELEAFSSQILSEKRLWQAAKAAGWEEHERNGKREKYSPGAFRRWSLCLPVYSGDWIDRPDLLDGRYLERGIVFSDWQVFPFIRARLAAYITSGGVAGPQPPEVASSSVVMADDGRGAQWPARLGNPEERQWYLAEEEKEGGGGGGGEAQARRQRRGEEAGTCVVLLCYDMHDGLNEYWMSKQCFRITQAELEELHELAQATENPGAAAAAAARNPNQPSILRRNSFQSSQAFRAGLAFALALDRLVPAGQRHVPLDAPCANDQLVPRFTTEQLENPLRAEVANDASLAFAMASLRYGLDKIKETEDRLAAESGQADDTTTGGGSSSSSSSSSPPRRPRPAAAASAASASHPPAPQEDDRRVKPRVGSFPHHQLYYHAAAGAAAAGGGGGGGGGGGDGGSAGAGVGAAGARAVSVRATLGGVKDDPDAGGKEEDEELLVAPGGGAFDGLPPAGTMAPSSGGSGSGAAPAPPLMATLLAIPLGRLGAAGGGGGGGGGAEGAAVPASWMPVAPTTASASASAQSSLSSSSSSPPLDELIAAFRRALDLVGAREQHEATLRRLQQQAASAARTQQQQQQQQPNGGGDIVAPAQEAGALFHRLLGVVAGHLPETRRLRQQAVQQATADIRAGLGDAGLVPFADAVCQRGSVEPLQRELARVLAVGGGGGGGGGGRPWTDAELDGLGRQLEQEKAGVTESLAQFQAFLRSPAANVAPDARATMEEKLRATLRDLEGKQRHHAQALRVRAAIAGTRRRLDRRQEHERALQALHDGVERRLLRLWGRVLASI